MHEMVLGVRSSAWSKGRSLGEQFKAIASHGFKYVNVIFDPEQSAAERREAVKVFRDLGLYSGQMGVDVRSYTSESGPASWARWVDMGERKVDFQSEAAIEFGAPDPDAEIERILEHLKRIGVGDPIIS